MQPKRNMLNDLYRNLAQELDISKTRREKAERAYGSVGYCLDADLDAHVYVQGSFMLGTVTRPTSGEDDDYDIDLVCEMPGMRHESPRRIKHVVGNVLKASSVYGPKLEAEGKRCWTLTFDEFHMDVLPCIPESCQPDDTAIGLTNREQNGAYTMRSSDPKAYQKWFEEQMGESLLRAKRERVGVAYASVDKVPTFSVRTPLQMTVQILKHHRDVMFEGRDDAPISMIITTLAALSYDQTRGIYDTVEDVLGKMASHVKVEDGRFVIQSPVDEAENYADKWNESQGKAVAFFDWLDQVKQDLVYAPMSTSGIDEIGKGLKTCLADGVVTRALSSYGKEVCAARRKGDLYATASAGIATSVARSAIPVPSHSFYGS